ncbi:hypothetical protein FOA43_001400 [Brettanomyces nanus]|uniref:Uncharacterized protein n=1 Tax=Eeniella nana TaxID=13502 RepID=A0A875S2N1_EENNA|nr:uncharacterized protein FOA43_001400 [Brettanomyces nanus]QPG74079.1 hypothetical protein FOA43_001400 [Brettanomyces nanus]
MHIYKILYEEAKAKGIMMPNHNFELDYIQDLKRFIDECNRKTELAERRLDLNSEDRESLTNITTEMDELDTKIAFTTQEIQMLSRKGDLDKAVQVSKILKTYVGQRSKVARNYSIMLENINQSAQQKLQVCRDCGAYLSKLDNDRRLVEHFTGKIHLGYVEMRSTLQELKSKYEKTN